MSRTLKRPARRDLEIATREYHEAELNYLYRAYPQNETHARRHRYEVKRNALAYAAKVYFLGEREASCLASQRHGRKQ